MAKYEIQIICVAEIEATSEQAAIEVANEIAYEIADAAAMGSSTHLIREVFPNNNVLELE